MKKPLLNEEEVLNVAQMLIDYHKREIQKVYPNCTNMEEVKQENENEVEAAEGTINTIRNIVNNYPQNINTVEKTNDELVNSLTELKDSIASLQTTVNTQLEDTNTKIEKLEFLENVKKPIDPVEEQSKYNDLEKRFIEKYNLHIKKVSSKILLTLLNYCLTFKTMIFTQGESAEVQILKYFVENDCNVKNSVMEGIEE